MFKNQKGITLVALVITIVVLIILATVSINFAIGGNLFGRAQEGSKLYSNASKEESDHLTNIDNLLQQLSANALGTE